jgi:gliding motility-associated-like protein
LKRFWSILFLLVSLVPLAQATHLIGGSMSYQQLNQNSSNGKFRYKVSLLLYRDCQGGISTTVPFEPTIKIGIYNFNNKAKFLTASIKLLSKRIVKAPGKTDCPATLNVCIEEGFYEGIIELDASTVGYEFTYEVCCRNNQNNIVTGSNGPVQGQTYYCKIPPTNIKNSSPVFTKGVPSPFMCANDTTAFLNTAFDPDGDSLVYYFVKPFGSNATNPGFDPASTLSIKNVQYNSGYSETFPLGPSGYSKIDRFNGLTEYFTNTTGNYIVAIEVAEYRNGVILSTVRLDLQIIFITCAPNRKPIISSDKGKNFVIEAGSKLCFNVISTDADNDNLKLTPSGDIFTGLNGWKGPKATLSAKTGAGSIVSEFCWQTSCDQASTKPYLFAVTVEDDGCPGKYNSVNFTIQVNPFISKLAISGVIDPCQKAITFYQASFLAQKSTLEWEVVQGIILSGQGTDQINVKWNGSGTGKVRCREISQYGCPGEWKEFSVGIKPSPATPIVSGKDTVCLNSNEFYSINTSMFQSFWFVKTGNKISNSNSDCNINWNTPGNQTIKVITVASGCYSDTGILKVNVRKPLPVIMGPQSVCPNAQNIEYNAYGIGKSTFNWSVSGGTIASGNGSSKLFINWGNPGLGSITVTETDRFGCVSDPIKYDVTKSYTLGSEAPKGKVSVCEFESDVPYYVFAANGTNYIWNVTGGNLVPPGNTSKVAVDWGKSGLGNVTVTRTAYDNVNNKSCSSLPSTINVLINPTPNAGTIDGNFEVCQLSDSLSYTLNGFVGSKYFWSVNGNSSNISGQGTKTIKIAWNTAGTFKLEVRELSKDSCWGTLVDSVVIVHPKPTNAILNGPNTICDPDLANRLYFVNGFNKSTYYWVVSNGTIASGLGTDSIFINWTMNEPAWLKVTETSEYGCVGDSILKEIVLDKLDIEMLVVSVGTPDDRMEITWKNVNSKVNSRSYEIQKRNTNDLVWNTITSLNNFANYNEQPLNTDLNSFDYRVNVKDLCGVEKTTDVHTNVLLTGAKTEDPYAIKMQFSSYAGFKNGVTKYVLYRKISDNGLGYQPYDSFTQPENMFYKNGLEGYNQCYRILSYENGGNNQVSWSNEICFNFSPTIYIPNAFSPNNDGLNDKFVISAGAIKTFSMKLYNRWGEQIWETKDYNVSWDGFYKEKPVQVDVYMYSIILTDFRDKEYRMNGTVHVIR